jgi:hypothetical protein
VQVAFQRDETLPEEIIQGVSVRTHDAVGDAGAEILAQRAHRSVFDQAKAARDALDAWLTGRGFTDHDESRADTEPAQDLDGKLARRVISQHLDACIDDARENLAKALAGLKKRVGILRHSGAIVKSRQSVPMRYG